MVWLGVERKFKKKGKEKEKEGKNKKKKKNHFYILLFGWKEKWEKKM